MSKKLECEIVQDLLPMYVDQLTSDYTTQRIKEHLKECPPCHEIYDLMTDAEEKHIEHKKEAKKLKRYLKKIKLLHVIIGAIIAVVAYRGIQYTYYQLAYEVSMIVKSDLVEVTELYELENGWLFLRLATTDSKRNSEFLINISPNELNFSIKRQVLPTKAEEFDTFDSTTEAYIIDPENGLVTSYNKGRHLTTAPDLTIEGYARVEWYRQSLQQEEEKLNAIYYQGQDEDDRVLIWERGMELPKLVE